MLFRSVWVCLRAVATSSACATATPRRRPGRATGLPNRRRSAPGTANASTTPSKRTPPVQAVGLIHHPADERKRFVIEGVLLVNGLFIEPSHFVDHIAEIEDIKQHLFIVTFFKNIDLRLQLAGRRFLLHIADDVSVDLQSLRVEG